MPPWKWALSDEEIYQAVFYAQAFSTADDYNSKWAPQYTDPFARNLKKTGTMSMMIANPAVLTSILAGLALWNLWYSQTMSLARAAKLKIQTQIYSLRRRSHWT
jgi:hypothetical protein